MTRFTGVVWLSVVGFVLGCRTVPSGPPTLVREQYTLNGPMRCDTTQNAGVSVSVAYLKLADNDTGTGKINDSLYVLAVRSVANWLDSTTLAEHPDADTNIGQAASLFAADYEAVKKDMHGLEGCWELETRSDTLHTSPRTITVQMETYANTGGAHPNSTLTYYTFDRTTGQRLTLTDFVTDTTALLGVLEREFRQQQNIPPATNLEDVGYFLHEGRFFLPANVGIGRDKLIFYYNPYEIAAYAVGPIQVEVPVEKLNGIVRLDRI